MNFIRITALTLSAGALLGGSPHDAGAQTLEQRIRAAGAATLTFEYPTREGVCGNGNNISIRSRDGESSTRRGRNDQRCDEGPAVVEITRRGTAITSLEISVGDDASPRGTSIGRATASEAVDFMFALAQQTGDDEIAGRAIFATTIADAPQRETAARMLALARTKSVRAETRKHAVFWLGNLAGEKATEGLTSILGDDSEEIEVRNAAIFAISRQQTDDALNALMNVARSSKEPELRRSALFWLGQRGDDPRVIRLLEDILLKG